MKGLLSKLFGQGRKEQQIWDTTPGGPYEVTITDQDLICTYPKRPTESIRWDQVREIMLVTISDGPFVPDVWYVFMGDGTGCSVPSEEMIEPDAGPNEEERGQPHVPSRTSLAHPSSSASWR